MTIRRVASWEDNGEGGGSLLVTRDVEERAAFHESLAGSDSSGNSRSSV